MAKGTATLQTTETSLQIIDALRDLNGSTVTEVATFLSLPKSTIYTHLQTLQANEYVVKHGKKYNLSLKFFELGEYTRTHQELADSASSEIDNMTLKTEERAHLFVEEHGLGVLLYRSKGAKTDQTQTGVGTRVPLHTNGAGKTILAHLPNERVNDIFNRHGLPAVTSNTITDRQKLLNELRVIYERGYAFSDEEHLEGLRSVAAPIMDGETVIGSISVAAPKSCMKDQRYQKELPKAVKETSNIIGLTIRNI